MRIAHVLKRHQSSEWGEAETVVYELLHGMRDRGVDATIFSPADQHNGGTGPFETAGYSVHRFRACIPVWRMDMEQRRELMGKGEKLMSFELVRAIRFAPALDLVHVHTGGLIGALSLRAARLRRIPCVMSMPDAEPVSLDFVDSVRSARPRLKYEWGRLFEFFLHSNSLVQKVDAIVTSCPTEAGFLADQYPRKRVLLQPNGISIGRFDKDCRKSAAAAFPAIVGRTVILCLANIDPSRNQQWLLYQLPAIRSEFPDALVVFSGACGNSAYQRTLERCIEAMNLHDSVLLINGLPPGDSRFIGLTQHARAMVLPSIVDPSGFAILQSWAAGVPVIASKTASAAAFIDHGSDGWLFDLSNPHTLQEGLRQVLLNPDVASRFATAGRRRVQSEFDSHRLSGSVKHLYENLIDAKFAARESSRSRYGFAGIKGRRKWQVSRG